MRTGRFHILRDDGLLTLCRHVPPRFDFAVRTVLPWANPLVLAQQIRQDLWRVLQSVRGFSPVVALRPAPAGWDVSAGGRAMGRVPPTVRERAQRLLDDPNIRTRWVRFAGGCR